MPFDPSQDPADPLVSLPRRIPRPLLFAGVAGACLLGAGLGLWARPSDLERELTAGHHLRPPTPPAAPRQIEIRVDRP
ncbi:MAG: hypothetical protein JWP50_430, partial [Phenylobacterium sp.]|nr:hypothetical protein [Phenylobacterium sp.]